MPALGRMKLRDWLQTQLDSGKFPGVKWIDREKGVFRLPWKHGSNMGWSLRDFDLFREWAIHTGKPVSLANNADPRRWKANFRCALNARKHVVPLPERSQPRGSSAYRVYVMKPRSKQKQKRRSECLYLLFGFGTSLDIHR